MAKGDCPSEGVMGVKIEEGKRDRVEIHYIFQFVTRCRAELNRMIFLHAVYMPGLA
jgi:hypothetical protein